MTGHPLTISDVAVIPTRLLVPHYLTASYLYYVTDRSPMTDEAFDFLCTRLHREWDKAEHIHRHLVEYEALEAGTCMLNRNDYPKRIVVGADNYLEWALSGRMATELHTLYAGRVPELQPEKQQEQTPTLAKSAGSRVRRRTR